MEQMVQEIRDLADVNGVIEINRVIKRLNKEGWHIDSITPASWFDADSNWLDRVYLLCSK